VSFPHSARPFGGLVHFWGAAFLPEQLTCARAQLLAHKILHLIRPARQLAVAAQRFRFAIHHGAASLAARVGSISNPSIPRVERTARLLGLFRVENLAFA
jgi:hypothetical protein